MVVISGVWWLLPSVWTSGAREQLVHPVYAECTCDRPATDGSAEVV